MGTDGETRVPIKTEPDILAARRAARALAQPLGFSDVQLIEIATAISEIARNILVYAREGEMRIGEVRDGRRRGVRIVASDRGPGIADLGAAMSDGISTGGGLGLGLPGARRLMDGFEISSRVGEGTTVTMVKWGTR
jgi:serine/threonine-protein kinase RsbT